MGRRFFRRLEPFQARLGNCLAGRLDGLAFSAGDETWRWREENTAALSPATAEMTVYLRWGGEDVVLWLKGGTGRLLAATALGIEPAAADALPEPLLRAGLELFADQALTGLERTIGLPVTLREILFEKTTPAWPAHPFVWVRRDGFRLEGAWLASGRDGDWLAAVERAAEGLPAATRTLPETVRLPGALWLGPGWRCPAGALRGLAVGDVVLTPGGGEWTERNHYLRFAPGYSVGAVEQDGVWATKGKLMHADQTALPPAPDGETDGTEVTPLAEVTVDLHLEVGRVSLSLGELNRLAAGRVVEFPQAADAPARLCAGGRTVAEGELVEVGGRIGLRVTRTAADAPGTISQEKEA